MTSYKPLPEELNEQAPLLLLLTDSIDRVVIGAIIALGHHPSNETLPHLLPLLKHHNPHIRLCLAHTLSTYHNQEAVKALIELSRDRAWHVRDWATCALGTLSKGI